MKILLIKTSSLGDVLHTLPALSDAMKQFPHLEVTWVLEESFAPIASWHPAVKKVLPIALRRWRRHFSFKSLGEIKQFLKALRAERYDYIIDAQGLLKSAIISRLARGPRYGFDRPSAREPFASFFYQHKISVDKNQHAIVRLRQLFSKILALPSFQQSSSTVEPLDYGLVLPSSIITREPVTETIQQNSQSLDCFAPLAMTGQKYLLFLHATTWKTKLYPETYWRRLIQYATEQGYRVILPWGNVDEKARSERLAKDLPGSIVPPALNLIELATLLKGASGVIAVDTGLGHLAAALSVPTLSLYGPTNPNRTGTLGKHQIHLAAQFECAPCLQRHCTYKEKKDVFPACFTMLSPEKVWKEFEGVLVC